MIVLNRKLFSNVLIYHTIWLVGIGLLIYCVVTAINNSFWDNNKSIMIAVIDEPASNDKQQEDFLIPGQFNLVEDAVMFNGAMMRPPKECTLGKMENKRYS